jgi:hypothetical protein
VNNPIVVFLIKINPLTTLSSPLGRFRRPRFSGFEIPEWQAEGLVEDYAHYRRGEAEAVSSAIADITGKPPHSLAEFVRDKKPVFLSLIAKQP